MCSATLATRALFATGALLFAAASSAQQAPHSVTCVDGTTDMSNVKSPCHGHGGIKPARGSVAVNAAPAAGAVAVNTPGSTSSTSSPAHPKPKPAPPAPGSTAALNGGTKIESSPRDPASPQKISTAASGGIGNTEVKKGAPASVGSGGIGNTAVHKEGQLGGTGAVGNTAVEKQGQMNKAAGGVGNTAVMKEGQMGHGTGGIGETEVKKGVSPATSNVPAVQKGGTVTKETETKNPMTPASHGSGGIGQTTESKAFKSTGRCKDGTYSTAKDPTTQCSSHGGVSKIYSTGATPP